MTDILIGTLIVAVIAVGAIGYLTVAGGKRTEHLDQATQRHPAGRTPRQLAPLDDGTWAPVCRSCGTHGDPIHTNNTSDAFAHLDAWDHTCQPANERSDQ